MNFENLIASKLSQYDNENPLYNKPISFDDWVTEWDFKNFDPNIYKHGLHQYPARFIPQLARKMLRIFTNENSTVLDIFSGSGTTLLESQYLNLKKAIGIELNPFAIFMANVKLTYLESKKLEKDFLEIKEKFNNPNFEYKIISFKNIEIWYNKNIIDKLSKLFYAITQIQNQEEKKFFLLCFSEISRKDSYLLHNGFKMYRSKQKIKMNYEPDVWADFEPVVIRNIKLNEESNLISKDSKTEIKIIQQDSRILSNEIEKSSVDFILTSPPYGDSKTTVAYGQYSRLPWQWITQADDIISLDNNLLGGHHILENEELLNKSETFKRQYQIIKQIDEKRAKDVFAFYSDLYETMKNAEYYLKENSYFVLVAGNRTVKGTVLQTDTIISEFGKTLNFKTETILSRNILNKRMAMKNSPSNKKGETSNTMLKESMIFLKK